MEKRNSISDSFVFDYQSKIDLFKTIINTIDNANDVRYNIVGQNIVKSSRFIEGTFILYPHLAKISFNTNFIDPVASYKSLSGKTWEFSRLFDGEKLVPTKGLYIVEPPLLELKSRRRRISKDLNEYERWLIQKLKELRVPRYSIVHYNNWGFSVYNEYRKAKLFQFEKLVEIDSKLYGYKVPMPLMTINYEMLNRIIYWNSAVLYNYEITSSKNFISIKPFYVYPGDAILIISVAEGTDITFKSPDSDERSITLKEPSEALLLWHPHIEIDLDD